MVDLGTAGVPVQPGEQIRANSVLPARRRAVTLTTADGLRLVADLALPPERDPVATIVCLHPLPEGGGGGTPGGSMDSHLLRKASRRLPALAGLAVLRLNTRGTTSTEGTSEGTYDEGDAERFDLAAALDLVEAEDLPAPWLVGWSFGTEIILRWGVDDPTPRGGVLIAPPLRRVGDPELDRWATDGRPLTAIVPELDDYLRPPEARLRFARVPQARVVEVQRSKHLFVGFAETALQCVVDAVAPQVGPLAAIWTG